ncbi:MAG: hypothetical protein H6502_01695 [Candidatus Woesearchaeota archaeon]|nr:MAG: hypothetical protein H6502_01695 [Candidatus Woesearchaeota archaeon]
MTKAPIGFHANHDGEEQQNEGFQTFVPPNAFELLEKENAVYIAALDFNDDVLTKIYAQRMLGDLVKQGFVPGYIGFPLAASVQERVELQTEQFAQAVQQHPERTLEELTVLAGISPVVLWNYVAQDKGIPFAYLVDPKLRSSFGQFQEGALGALQTLKLFEHQNLKSLAQGKTPEEILYAATIDQAIATYHVFAQNALEKLSEADDIAIAGNIAKAHQTYGKGFVIINNGSAPVVQKQLGVYGVKALLATPQKKED